jgi:hypothetical protein
MHAKHSQGLAGCPNQRERTPDHLGPGLGVVLGLDDPVSTRRQKVRPSCL